MTSTNDLGKILKQQRVMMSLTMSELAAKSGMSVSYVGRIENGKRFPSARILCKIAKPLGFEEVELLTFAGYLPEASTAVESEAQLGRLDPYVAAVLSHEPVEIQRTVLTILTVLKSLAKP